MILENLTKSHLWVVEWDSLSLKKDDGVTPLICRGEAESYRNAVKSKKLRDLIYPMQKHRLVNLDDTKGIVIRL